MTDELREFTGANASQIADQIEDRKQREIDAWEREMEAQSEQELSSAEITAELQAEENPTPVVWGGQKTVAEMIGTLTYRNYKYNRDISPHLKPSQFYCVYGKELVDEMEKTYQKGKTPNLVPSKINNLVIDGVNYEDAPKFCDAYVVSCDIDGKEATDDELDLINEDSDLVHELVTEELWGAW